MAIYEHNYSFGSIIPFNVRLFVHEKTYGDSVKHFWKIDCKTWRSSDDQTWSKMQFCSHHSIVKYQVAILSVENTEAVLSISENLRFKGQGNYVAKYMCRQKCSLELHAIYKGRFWRPMCDFSILSQLAGGGMPSTLQCWILSSYLLVYQAQIYVGSTQLMYLNADKF